MVFFKSVFLFYFTGGAQVKGKLSQNTPRRSQLIIKINLKDKLLLQCCITLLNQIYSENKTVYSRTDFVKSVIAKKAKTNSQVVRIKYFKLLQKRQCLNTIRLLQKNRLTYFKSGYFIIFVIYWRA